MSWYPLTPARWPDLARLFRDGRANDNCWCAYPRMRSPSERIRGMRLPCDDPDSNEARLRRLVEAGEPVGILLYDHSGRDEPIGWCGVAPRTALRYYDSVVPPGDGTGVWAVACLYVTRDRYGTGVSVALLEAAAEYAAGEGATVLEGCPRPPGHRVTYRAALWGWTGAFTAAGFTPTGDTLSEHVVMRRGLTR